jgi:hypothetical protein
MLRSFNLKYIYAILDVRNIAFRRALSTKRYQYALIVGLLLWPLNCMPCLPELYYSAEIFFRNWFSLSEFDWCGSLDTMVSMGMKRPTHLQERDQVLLSWSQSLVFHWHLSVSSGGSVCGYLNHTAPQSRMWLKKLNLCLTRYLLSLPRSKLRILVGLKTGHCLLNKHLHNMHLTDEPICITCGLVGWKITRHFIFYVTAQV